MKDALEAVVRGNTSGAEVLELRLDLYKDFSSVEDLEALVSACKLPYIVTYRPVWEGCV
jgi:3-dehydroquinate dehydratase / shikimate dehydrogenase